MTRFRLRTTQLCILLPLAASLLATLPSGATAQVVGLEGRTVPRQGYFFAFEPYNRGRYGDALKAFRSAASSGINTGNGRWIDSICYYTMLGECFYQIGDLPNALDQYNNALKLMIARRGWLGRIQLQGKVQPMPIVRQVPWGPSVRKLMPGTFPETMLSQQGTNINRVLQQGGTVAPPEMYPVRVTEIMRCIALSLRRRNELLGPVAAQIPFTQDVVKELSRRQVPPNHWMQSLVNVQLALAKSAAGEKREALRLLQQSLAVGGRIDHPLTGIALLHLGELALEADNLKLAQQSFVEATYPASYYGQPDVVAEAFDKAARVYALQGGTGIFPPLSVAATWLQANRLDQAATTVLLAGAENSAASGDPKVAARLIGQIRRGMGRSDLPRSDLGARLLYTNAMLAFQSNRIDAGKKALRESFALSKIHSKRLFRVEVTTKLHAANEFSALVASRLFADLLREPTAADWKNDTRETLLFEMTPHVAELERWLDLAIERRETDMVLLVSEMIRRHKFYSRLPLGGRLLAMRWLTSAPSAAIQGADEESQALIGRIARWSEVAAQVDSARTKLAELPVVADPRSSPLAAPAKQITEGAKAQEELLWSMALSPLATKRVFPPLRTQEEIEAKLKPGQAVLLLIKRRQATHAILLSQGNSAKQWQLPAARLKNQLIALMRELGNFDSKQVLSAERLTNEKWKTNVETIFKPFAAELTADKLAGISELVIVPDGQYWYFPFELASISSQKMLIDLVKVRYAPTAGLAIADGRPAQSGPRTIVHGRLYNRETEAITAEVAASLKTQRPKSYVLRKRLPATSRYLAPSWAQLIVLDDIEDLSKDPLGWSIAQYDRGKPGGSLNEWLQMPWGGPELVVLPGFHTAAENGLRGKQTGDEMMIASCGMLASGTRTVLLSRWRSGGQVSMDLVREFCGGLGDSDASEALQRSIALARSTELDPSVEPRLKNVDADDPPSAEHPFFWASYMLIGK